jgi:hypothetical protein
MPHKYFSDQFDDEEVLFLFRKHPVVMRKGLLLASACLLIGPLYTLVMSFMNPEKLLTMGFFFASLGISAILGAIVMLPKWMSWYFSIYIVTDQRFIQISQKGMFHRSVVDMSLHQIQMVNYEIAGLQQTLLGFGTIVMQTVVGDLVIHEVHHPAVIQKKLLEILRTNGGGATPVTVQNNDEDEIVEEYETKA